MDIRSAVLESRKRDKETKNIKNKGFKGIAREDWVSDSIPGPRLVIIPSKLQGQYDYCEMVPFGYGWKVYGSTWRPTFDDLAATDWFVTILTRKIDSEISKGGD